MVFLYILLGISLIALIFLGVVVFRGGNKNSKSFQAELAHRNAKKKSKQLANDFVEGKVSFEELKQTIANVNTIQRIETNYNKLIESQKQLEISNKQY